MFLKKFFDKQAKRKKKLKKIYDMGFCKAEQIKNEEIRKLKMKYGNLIRTRENKILEQQKKVQRIEEALNQHSELVCQTNTIIKKIHNNSYANSMLINNDHQRIETMNDEIEMLEIRVSKSKTKLDTKILDFKKVSNQ